MKLKERGDTIIIKIPFWKKVIGFLAMGIWPPSKAIVIHYLDFMSAYEVRVGFSFKYKTCLIATENVEHEST